MIARHGGLVTHCTSKVWRLVARVVRVSLLLLPLAINAAPTADIRVLRERVEAETSTLYQQARQVQQYREIPPDDPRLAAKARKRMEQAIGRLRLLITAEIQARLRNLSSRKQRLALVQQEYHDARRALRQALATIRQRLQRDLKLRDSRRGRARSRGYHMARLQARLIRLSALFDVLVTYQPVIDGPGGELGERHTRWTGKRISYTVYRLGELADRIAANDPNNPVVPHDISRSVAVFVQRAWHDMLVAEFRRLAREGLIVDPATGAPVRGMLRKQLEKNAIDNLIEYLRVKIRFNEKRLPIFTVWQSPSHRPVLVHRLGQALESPEYQILNYLTAGIEPSRRVYFLAIARVIRLQQEKIMDWYNTRYLGGKWHEVGLGKLLRASDAWGTGKAGITQVRKRMQRFNRDMDFAARAFTLAATMPDPKRLPPKVHALLKSFGYILTRKDGSQVYGLPDVRHAIARRLGEARGNLKLPGASVLDVIDLRTIGETTISVVVPEYFGARVATLAGKALRTRRALLALRLLTETASGTLVSAGIEAWKKDGLIDWDSLVLTSIVLGPLQQIAGGVTDAAFPALIRRLQQAGRARALTRWLARNRGLRAHIERYVATSLGLATETTLTSFYQMYVEGQMDEANWQRILINSALSRVIAGATHWARGRIEAHQLRRHAPEWLRNAMRNNPRLRAEVLAAVNRNLEHQRNARERYESVTSGKPTPARIFLALLSNRLSWKGLKYVYAASPEQMRPIMQRIKKMRDAWFDSIIRHARAAARKDLDDWYQRQRREAIEKAGGEQQAQAALKELEARYRAEVDLLNRELIAPGSGDPTSDIDRSAASHWLRRHLVNMYRLYARLHGNGDFVTSARAFDVNEYINVFPFITANGPHVRAMSKTIATDLPGAGNMRHGDAMEALSLAGALQHMTSRQARRYIANQTAILKRRIEAGELPRHELALYRRKVDVARRSLAASRRKLARYRKQIAAERGMQVDDPEVDLLARDRLYDERMVEIRDMQWQLHKLERQYGPDSDQAITQRAKIERKMSIAMRDGIETYSHTIGLDIVVNRVQSAYRLDSDGSRIPKKNPDGSVARNARGEVQYEKMKLWDRMTDPDFTLKKDLRMYGPQDIRGLINDQIMFIIEHVNGFNSGHESTYEAGRAMGKYIERAFLGMKIMGMDIRAVLARPPTDPTRRLLEFARDLVRVKGDPKALNATLARYSRTFPQTPERGLAELFLLMEKVLPGMAGLTGIERHGMRFLTRRYDNPMYRRARIQAMARERRRRRYLIDIGGQQLWLRYLQQRIEQMRRELDAVRRELTALERHGGEYLATDWQLVSRFLKLHHAAVIQRTSLPWQDRRSALYERLRIDRNRARIRLNELRFRAASSRTSPQARLYESSPVYTRLKNRETWLNERLQQLQRELKTARAGAAREKALDRLNLGGQWICGHTLPKQDATARVSHQGRKLVLRLRWKSGERSLIQARYERGRLRGHWTDPVRKGQRPAAGNGPRIPAGGQVEALIKANGKRFQFTGLTSNHPSSPVNWIGLACMRPGQDGAARQQGFVSVRYLQGNRFLLEQNRGQVRLDVRGPGDKKLANIEARLYRGRRQVGGWAVRPGRYRVAFSLSGAIHTVPVAVRPGMITVVSVRPGLIRYRNIAAGGGRLNTLLNVVLYDRQQVRLADTQRHEHGFYLPPGQYDIQFHLAFGPVWKRKLVVSPGSSQTLTIHWSALRLRGAPAVRNSVAIRPAQATGVRGGWLGVAPGTARIDLAPGDYDVRWKNGARLQQRRINVRPGKQFVLNLE